MPAVRKRTAACTLVAILVQSVLAPLAIAEDFMIAPDKQPRLMLYVSKAFGEKDRFKSAPQLGLRFERSVEMGALNHDPSPIFAQKMSLVDLRWTKGYGQSFHLLDVPLYRSPLQLNSTDGSSAEDSSSDGSTSEDSFGGYGMHILVGTGILAMLCATNTIICEDDDEDYTQPADNGPASGG